MPTISYPNIEELPKALQDEVAGRRSLNVFRMLMHSPQQAPSFLTMSDSLRHGNSLPPFLRELVILRVCHVYNTPYATHHHAKRARLEGLSEAAIAAASEGIYADLPTAETSMLAWTDEILANHGLLGTQRDALLASYSLQQLEDLVFTISFFQLVCNFLNTFDVTIESQNA